MVADDDSLIFIGNEVGRTMKLQKPDELYLKSKNKNSGLRQILTLPNAIAMVRKQCLGNQNYF